MFTTIEVVVILLGLLYLLRRWPNHAQVAPLPPGPDGLPLIGNIADIPLKYDWLTYAEWGRKWGGICSAKVLGQHIIVINSSKVLAELSRKGEIYSGRPRLEMAGELVGFSEALFLLPYGSRVRTYRRYLSHFMGGPAALQQHIPQIEQATHNFLKRVLGCPDKLSDHLHHLTGGVILRLTYGIEVQENEDPFVNLIERANDNLNAALVPGAFFVDFLPALRHLPEWLPGMSFKRKAREWAKVTSDTIEVPFMYTKQQMISGSASPSFVSTLLEEENALTANDIRDVKFCATSIYGGGVDTITSSEYAFFLAMVLYPDVQKKAQAEIDAIVGNDRLPESKDRPNIPYVNAIVTEVLRWSTVGPTGVPHAASEDGIINGYLIPKGSLIIPNLWNMLHDPDIYPDPFKFDPDRFIATPEKIAQQNPRELCFGFGRRVCPGRHLADASLFSTVAMSLAVFDITKTIDNGVPITPVYESTSGIISYPKPFRCTIKSRSAKVASLIALEQC